jgi:hypothetical protein
LSETILKSIQRSQISNWFATATCSVADERHEVAAESQSQVEDSEPGYSDTSHGSGAICPAPLGACGLLPMCRTSSVVFSLLLQLFCDVIVVLVENLFYVTEAEGMFQQLVYYRRPVWRALR